MAKQPNKQQNAAQTRKEIFVREYIVDFNATRAAEAAGYSKKTAGSQGHRLMKSPDIQKMVKQQVDARKQRVEVTADRVLGELALIGFSNMKDYIDFETGEPRFDFSKLTREQAAAISEITVDTSVENIQRVETSVDDKPQWREVPKDTPMEDIIKMMQEDDTPAHIVRRDEVKKVKFKLHDKKGALVDLGRHLGLFTERHVDMTYEQFLEQQGGTQDEEDVSGQ